MDTYAILSPCLSFSYHPPIYLFTPQPVHLFLYLSVLLTIHLPTYLPTYLPIHPSTCIHLDAYE